MSIYMRVRNMFAIAIMTLLESMLIYAADVKLTITPPGLPVPSGLPISVNVVFTNNGKYSVTILTNYPADVDIQFSSINFNMSDDNANHEISKSRIHQHEIKPNEQYSFTYCINRHIKIINPGTYDIYYLAKTVYMVHDAESSNNEGASTSAYRMSDTGMFKVEIDKSDDNKVKNVIGKITGAFESTDVDVREKALSEMLNIDSPDIIPHLNKHVNDMKYMDLVLERLSEIDSREANEIINKNIKMCTSEYVINKILMNYSKRRNNITDENIDYILKITDRDIKLSSIDYMSEFGKRYIDRLVKFLSDDDAQVVNKATDAINAINKR